MLQEQTGRLSHLAEILLDMTGVQTVERSERISLAALTDEVFCDLASVAEQKDVELIQQEGDCIITGSYLLLYRAVYNLVENAIKYNHSGGKVTVNIHPSEEITDTSTSVNYVFLEVSDTGIGIPPEYQEKSSPRSSVWTNQEAALWEVPAWGLHLSVKLSDSITDR